jgi:hypothetical protein
MLFQVVHTHGHETSALLRGARKRVGCAEIRSDVTVAGAYAAPLDHVLYLTAEAGDLASVVRARAPLNALGTAVTSLVIGLDELLGLVGGSA